MNRIRILKPFLKLYARGLDQRWVGSLKLFISVEFPHPRRQKSPCVSAEVSSQKENWPFASKKLLLLGSKHLQE